MLSGIKVTELGVVPRNLRKSVNASLKEAWSDTGEVFHREYREKRFTEEHAREAGYYKRKGQNLPFDSRGWRRMYYGRKYRSAKMGGGKDMALPLVKSGETRELVRSASITSTSQGVKVRYSGARKLNYRNAKSRIRMNEEFTRITEKEADSLSVTLDERLGEHLKRASERRS